MYSILIFLAIVGALVYFKWPVVEKDVDKLVLGITSMVDKLKAAEEAHAKAASIHTAQAAESTLAANQASNEAARASSIAMKLEGLVS